MNKPVLIADVRSMPGQSLPDTTQTNETFPEKPHLLEMEPDGLATLGLKRPRELMNMLQMATALNRLLPEVRLVLMNTPPADGSDNNSLTADTIVEITGHHQQQSSAVRAALSSTFSENLPAAVEELLLELGVIERQDRSYSCNREHDRDATMAWIYRKRRRKDILEEINDLKVLSIPE